MYRRSRGWMPATTQRNWPTPNSGGGRQYPSLRLPVIRLTVRVATVDARIFTPKLRDIPAARGTDGSGFESLRARQDVQVRT